ncbi:MAG: hypothetical protein CMG54_00390 [Candidatus Marinimicrobia bacterium]|nr:hypothetical protein [Candidatus Neomarinimicrobiota bacterium]|tara:strand:- start:3249 stop:3938 length:690 start_codon:yes stop_codon:yes gene_type:complete
MIVLGHRGAPSLAHENTIESFVLALKNSVDGLEFDIQQTKDYQLITHHDPYIVYQNKKHIISNLLLSEIKNMQLSYNIPILDEVLALCPPNKIINIEIKTRDIINTELINNLIGNINKYKLNESVIISSFNPFLIIELKKRNPNIKVGQLWCLDKQEPWYVTHTTKDLLSPYSFHANVDHINKDMSDWARSQGMKIYLYTVNTSIQLNKAHKVGADGIFTDYPKILQER